MKALINLASKERILPIRNGWAGFSPTFSYTSKQHVTLVKEVLDILHKQSWHQHFVSNNCESQHSDNDVKARAATAGEALEESDDVTFSVQLP